MRPRAILAGLLSGGVMLSCACGPPELRYPEMPMPDCPKGAPRALLNRRNRTVLTALFRRTGFGRAEEVARLRGSVRLTIKHAGCDKLAQVFVFELKERPRPAKDRAFWYRRAGELLRSLAAGSRSAEGLRLMARSLESAAASSPPPFGTPVKLDDYQSLAVHMEPRLQAPLAVLRVRYDFKR